MPRKEPFDSERQVIVARGVEHHFNDAFDMAVCRLECANIHAEAPGNRGSDLFRVQLFPLDLAALEHIGGQGLQHGFLVENRRSKDKNPAGIDPRADRGEDRGEIFIAQQKFLADRSGDLGQQTSPVHSNPPTLKRCS